MLKQLFTSKIPILKGAIKPSYTQSPLQKAFLPLLTGGSYLYYQNQMFKRQSSDCLGIFGFVGNEQAEDTGLIAEEVCIRGLRELSVKGYDACGIASI